MSLSMVPGLERAARWSFRIEITKDANANKLMARFMNQVITYDEACLVLWQGGNMRNAIPRECEVVITVPADEGGRTLSSVRPWRWPLRVKLPSSLQNCWDSALTWSPVAGKWQRRPVVSMWHTPVFTPTST